MLCDQAAVVSDTIVVKNNLAEQGMVYYAEDAQMAPQISGMEIFCAGAQDCNRLSAKHHLGDS